VLVVVVGDSSSNIAGSIVGPDAAVGDGVYAGGGSLEETVKAFIPGRFGRLVGGDGFVRGCEEGLLMLRERGVQGRLDLWDKELF